ncbi:hypothetical protein, partial [Pelagicoccus mobilis]
DRNLNRTALVRDPYAGWCERGGAVRLPSISIGRRNKMKRDRQLSAILLSGLVALLLHGCGKTESNSALTTVLHREFLIGNQSYSFNLLYTSEDPSTAEGLVRFTPVAVNKDSQKIQIAAIDPPTAKGYEVAVQELGQSLGYYREGTVIFYDERKDEVFTLLVDQSFEDISNEELFNERIRAKLEELNRSQQGVPGNGG